MEDEVFGREGFRQVSKKNVFREIGQGVQCFFYLLLGLIFKGLDSVDLVVNRLSSGHSLAQYRKDDEF